MPAEAADLEMTRRKSTALMADKFDMAARSRIEEDLASGMTRLTRQRLLTHEEEIALALRAKAGDSKARHRLIESNMRLVISIARHYHSSLVPFEDLVQEGAIGLMTAVERFDPSRGFRFSTYATHWIKQSVSRAIDNKSRAIRVPAHVSEMLRKIDRVRGELIREQEEDPTTEQIAARMGVPARRVIAYLQAGQDMLSLDMLVGDIDGTTLAAMLDDKNATDPEDELILHEVSDELRDILESLTEREKTVMRLRLGFAGDGAQALQDIGKELHLSRERVRQIEMQAIRHMRALAKRRRLRDFLAD